MTVEREAILTPIESEPYGLGENLHFLLVDHSPEKVADIYRQIADSDADIVLLELVGSPTALRENVKSRINEGILAENLDDRVRATAGLSQSFKDLVWDLAGSRKHLSFIDIANDSPEYDLVLKARSAKKEGSSLYDQYLAESIKARDNVLASQIKAAIENNPNERIFTVMGAMHMSVVEEFDYGGIDYSDSGVQERARSRMASLALSHKV